METALSRPFYRAKRTARLPGITSSLNACLLSLPYQALSQESLVRPFLRHFRHNSIPVSRLRQTRRPFIRLTPRCLFLPVQVILRIRGKSRKTGPHRIPGGSIYFGRFFWTDARKYVPRMQTAEIEKLGTSPHELMQISRSDVSGHNETGTGAPHVTFTYQNPLDHPYQL